MGDTKEQPYLAQSSKRKFDEMETVSESKNNFTSELNYSCNNSTSTHDEKRHAKEGFSWWTCMQLGLPLSNSKPQPTTTHK